jgi:hypothetical protein
MDALQGCAKIQFGEGLIRRDLNKARQAFAGASTVATGNWGCGAFGNDHVLKFLQQWLAASDAGVTQLYYHTYADRRSGSLGALAQGFQGCTIGELWTVLQGAAQQCGRPGPGIVQRFHGLIDDQAKVAESQGKTKETEIH